MKTKHAQLFSALRFVLSAFCLMALLVPLPSYGADTGTVKGKIIDKADGEGVYGASVTIGGTTIGTATDMNGNFTLQNVPAKSQKISVSIVGYAPASQVVTVSTGQTAVVNLQLGQTTIMASEVVVGASLYKQDRLEVPVTANVVSNEKIRQEPSATLDKTLEEVPGVNINRSAGNSTSTVQIRGSNTYQGGGIGTRVQGLYDGFPINTPESGEIVWTNINMNAADKVEILKGAAATLYGSGAMGGVVNVFGHLPDKMEVKAGASAGFYDATPSDDQSLYRKDYTPWLWNTYFGLGNKSGKLNYSLLYTHSNDDGYRENTQMEMNDVKLKARYDINAKQYVQISSFYNETKGGYASTWPYSADIGFLFLRPYTPIPVPPYSVPSGVDVNVQFNPITDRAYDAVDDVYTDDTIQRKNALIGLNYVNMLSDKLSMDARLYYTYNATRINYNPTDARQTYGFPYMIYMQNPNPIDPNIPVSPSFLTIYDRYAGEFNETISNRYGAGVKFDWRASDSHRILFGMDGNIVDVQSTQYVADLPVEGELGSIQEKNASVFVQDEWKITDRLTALLSARYDWSNINADTVDYLNYVAVVSSPTYPAGAPLASADITNPSVEAISPRIALNFKAADDMSFRASWGMSFRAPTLAERFVRDAGLFQGIPNPELDKETMTAYELGVYKQFGDKVSLDIAGYINDYENLIESRNLNPNYWPILFQYTNLTKARIWGIEAALNIRPSSMWSMNFGYAYMNATNKSADAASLAGNLNPDPEWLAYRPEHTVSAGVTLKPVSKLSLNLNGRYVSKYKAVSSYPNPEGTNYPGGFIILNTGVKFQAGETASLSILCRNIGNLQYEEAEWFRAPGRSYVAGVDFTF